MQNDGVSLLAEWRRTYDRAARRLLLFHYSYWRTIPWPPAAYSYALFLFIYLCVFYFPISDSDALASYVFRFKLEEFGPIRQSATLSLQAVFPRFFDGLLYQCSKWEWFHALPSFIAFVIIVVCLFRDVPRKAYPWMLFVLLCSPALLTQSMSQKNDIAVAAFAILGVSLIRFVQSPIAFLPLGLLSITLLLGTKWSAIPLAAMIGLLMMWRLIRDPAIRPKPLTLYAMLLMTPVYLYTSSAATYFENYLLYGSPTPVLPDLQESYPSFGLSGLQDLPDKVFGTLYGTLIDVARLPLVVLRDYGDTNLFPALTINKWYLLPDPFVTSHCSIGPLLAVVLVVNLVALKGACGLSRYRSWAAIALLYYLVLAIRLPLNVGNSRYLLPVYVLSAPQTACLLRYWLSFRMRWMRPVCWGLAVYVSATTVLMSNDRTLPISERLYPTKNSFTHYVDDHDNLMFLGLPGFIGFFREYKKQVQVQDSLLVLDDTQPEQIIHSEVPVLYPFVRRRLAVNTGILNTGKSRPEQWVGCDFVLLYSRRGWKPELPGYQEVSATDWPCCRLYRRTNTRNESPFRLLTD